MQRKRYFSTGLNHRWHMDGYDKLKLYGFPIHGCIGWSRKRLKVCKSNNHPDIIVNFFLDTISEVRGCPLKVGTDSRIENGVMADMKCTLRNSVDGHKYGTSPANKRIEG